MRRAITAGLALALAGTGLTAAPASAAPVSDSTLTWKISECAFSVSTVLPACGSLTETQSVAGNVARTPDGWRFTGGTGDYDPATGTTNLAFQGSVTIGNTNRGGYRISLRDPEVRVDADGAGQLLADLAFTTSATSPETVVPDVRVVDLPAVPDGTAWTVTPPWTGVGTPATPAPLEGKQFAQPLIDALPASLKGWFWASGSSSDAFKAPAPVGVSLSATVAPPPVETPTTPVPAPAPAAPASPSTTASTAKVTVTGTDKLAVNESATITVTGTGFDPARRGGPVQGIYVVFGPNTATVGYTEPAVFGAAQYLPVAPDDSGAFSTTLKITGKYTDGKGTKWNGRTTQLGVSTWAAHSHAITDWDTFTPVSFRAAKAKSTTKAALVDRTITRSDRAVVRAQVVSKKAATGTVTVTRGGKVLATKKIRAKHDGVLRLTLPKLKAGTHTLKVRYSGNGSHKASVSKKLTLSVRR